MNPWASRPSDERALLNPGFCSMLLWYAATGYEGVANASMPVEIAFLVLPVVLHGQTRASLPRRTGTSLAVWLNKNPLSRSVIADRARSLVPFTKEAVMFGGVHGLFVLSSGAVTPVGAWKKRIARSLGDSTEEVRTCARRAEFVGKWFANAGSPGTLMAILGVRP